MQHYRGSYGQNLPWSSCLLLLLLQYIFLFEDILLASVLKDHASAGVNCDRMANYACLSLSQVVMCKSWFFYLKSKLLVVSWLWPDTRYPQKPLIHPPAAAGQRRKNLTKGSGAEIRTRDETLTNYHQGKNRLNLEI